MSGKSALSRSLPVVRRFVLSFVTLSWLNPILRLGKSRPLRESDLPVLPESESSRSVNKKSEGFHGIIGTLVPMFVLAVALSIVNVAINIILPLLIGRIINTLTIASSSKGPSKEDLVLSAIFVGLQLANAIIYPTIRSITLVLGIRICAYFTDTVYRKALHASHKDRRDFPAATINSFINTDIPIIEKLPESIVVFLASLFQIGVAIFFLVNMIGLAAWIAIGAYFALIIFQSVFYPVLVSSETAYLDCMDTRTKHLREFLYGISVIKLQATEEHLEKKIVTSRSIQTTHLLRFTISAFFICIAMNIQQLSMAPITFISYFALGNSFNPSVIFSLLGFIYALIDPSSLIGKSFSKVLQAAVSYKRVRAFLDSKQIQPEEITEIYQEVKLDAMKSAIHLSCASFTWGESKRVESDDAKHNDEKPSENKSADYSENQIPKKEKESYFTDESRIIQDEQDAADEPNNTIFMLDNLDLSIPCGSFVAVVGSVGSGKTSLLEALVGSMCKTNGSAKLYGKVAYCTQEPCILSGTIEDNILFGRTDDATRSRLSAAVDASCLAHDLTLMPAGLGTQIGEKGIMLSGGQRARVALARALAHDADVVLLDDPLTALDAHVGRTVLDKAICGMLKSKTVVLVTHQLHVLPKTDLVVVMDSGKIVETGAFRDLMAKQDSALAQMMSGYHYDEHTDSKQDNIQTPDKASESIDDDKALAEALKKYEEEKAIEEDRREGVVALKTFKSYFSAAGSLTTLSCFVAFLLSVLSGSVLRITLSVWADQAWGWSNSKYFYFYVGASLFDVFTVTTVTGIGFLLGYITSIHFHDKALSGLIYAPMHFFDGQPIGRILNRMTADVKTLDMDMSIQIFNVINCLMSITVSIIVQIYASPYLSILIVLLIVIYGYIFRYFQASYRELKRLQSIMKSPVLAHVSESLNGISIIHAYAATDIFIAQQRSKLDRSNTSVFLLNSTQYWLMFRLSTLSVSMTALLLALAILLPNTVSVSAVGLALTSLLDFGVSLMYGMMNLGEAEASFNSVERLNHYAHDLPSEAPRQLPTDPETDAWPTNGAISFKDLEIRYPSRLNHAVIDRLSIDILPGEKVAVVGRTGSGKSTLMTALFRIVEASSGSITVDGIDIAKLGLRTLRSRLQIIPQEPVLFDGTIRSNIDMHGSHFEDEALWDALETVGLKDYVASLDGKLDAHVDEGGSNLSAGQRQLLCLCRSILARPKILVMDEATASVDADADRRIQAAVTSEFRNTTVLSIAHRLNTIAAYDKVVVLDAGKVVECDAPHVLLEKPGSVFGGLVDATGRANSAAIREVAATHYAETKKDQ